MILVGLVFFLRCASHHQMERVVFCEQIMIERITAPFPSKLNDNNSSASSFFPSFIFCFSLVFQSGLGLGVLSSGLHSFYMFQGPVWSKRSQTNVFLLS